MAEARACLQAITKVEEMGFQDICVEGDAVTVIRKLNSREISKAEHGMALKGWRYEDPPILDERCTTCDGKTGEPR